MLVRKMFLKSLIFLTLILKLVALVGMNYYELAISVSSMLKLLTKIILKFVNKTESNFR